MSRTPVTNFRLDEETKARWEAAAKEANLSLSGLIRRAVEAFLRSGRRS